MMQRSDQELSGIKDNGEWLLLQEELKAASHTKSLERGHAGHNFTFTVTETVRVPSAEPAQAVVTAAETKPTQGWLEHALVQLEDLRGDVTSEFAALHERVVSSLIYAVPMSDKRRASVSPCHIDRDKLRVVLAADMKLPEDFELKFIQPKFWRSVGSESGCTGVVAGQ
jgi:hypothetical protein